MGEKVMRGGGIREYFKLSLQVVIHVLTGKIKPVLLR